MAERWWWDSYRLEQSRREKEKKMGSGKKEERKGRKWGKKGRKGDILRQGGKGKLL